MNNEECVESKAGPFRLVVAGQDIRGFWSREDAEQAADDLARNNQPASVRYAGRKGWPERQSLARYRARM